MNGGGVLVPCADEFRSVPGEKEVLQINVSQNDLLVAPFERIQSAVGVLFQKLKIRCVVFDFVGVQVAEDSNRGLLVHKQESAEIRIELLNARAHAGEIIIGAEVVQFHFAKRFLQS